MAYTFDASYNIPTLLNEVSFPVYKPGDVVKGTVVGKTKKHILVDLEDQKITGIITGKEMNDVMGTAKNLELGQEVLAIVLHPENEEGNLMLSLRKAGQLHAWDKYLKAFEEKEVIEVVPTSANKGGLLVLIAGIKAFIPVSQLSPENYPRVDDSNATKILEKLQALVGKKFKVRVIGVDKEAGKLIFSEREAFSDARKQALAKLSIGDVYEGVVTGLVKFGVFVTFNEVEGLVHISEIAWGHVKNPSQYAKVGDTMKVKVIGVEGEKISLSLKQLQDDPWVKATQQYAVGSTVTGIINKVSEFGAFVTLDEEVNGLIHLSEIDHGLVSDPNKYFSEGDEITAKVIEIDTKEHRIALSVKALKPVPEKTEEEEA
jgi:small subunit ribosomal protein S1